MSNNLTNETVQNEQEAVRLRACALLIILFALVIAVSLGTVLFIILLPNNGLIIETLDNGEKVTYMYYNNEKLTGWQAHNWSLLYFEPTDGHMVTGRYEIDGTEYYFDPTDGRLITNETVTHDDGTTITYDRYGKPKTPTTPGIFTEADGTTALNGTNGKLSGWHTVDGKTYYFQRITGRMLKNEEAYIDGKYYIFDNNGQATEVIK